jgi:hypothetical protein
VTMPMRTLLTISAAARLVGRSASTLRAWERRGLLHPARDSAGRRLYRASQVMEAAASIRRPGNDPVTGRFASPVRGPDDVVSREVAATEVCGGKGENGTR